MLDGIFYFGWDNSRITSAIIPLFYRTSHLLNAIPRSLSYLSSDFLMSLLLFQPLCSLAQDTIHEVVDRLHGIPILFLPSGAIN